MEYIAIGLSGVAVILLIIVLFVIRNNNKNNRSLSDNDMKCIREAVSESINTLSSSTTNLLVEKTNTMKDTIESKLQEIESKLNLMNQSLNTMKDSLDKENAKINNDIKEYYDKLNSFMMRFVKTFSEVSAKQRDEMTGQLSKELEKLSTTTKEALKEFKENTASEISKMSKTVYDSLNDIRKDNNEKIDKINESVNEKLEKTLESKLKDSFENVIKQIGNVNTAIGEIKGLASDVGSLKNVLTNVKTKGIVGEVILGNIIKEFLTTDQYYENVVTKANSSERVEFAIKLPGTKDDPILLPIDSKFPYESYSRILSSNSIDEINEAKKELRSNLLKYAKDVSEKYLDVPNTTDFGIIFLPLEGLYLEVLNMGLFEEIQKKYHINITGPTTLTAFINSLNMGFKSLMIQKRSADVFKLLGAVKTEFGKFADVLSKTQKKFTEATDELDKLVGTRTRMINSKLKSIDSLSDEDSKLLLEDEEK